MRNTRNAIDLGGEIPHIILCNMTRDKAFEIIWMILKEGIYYADPTTGYIHATTAEGEPYVFILNDILEDNEVEV